MAAIDDKLTEFLVCFVSSAQNFRIPYHLLNKSNEELKRLTALSTARLAFRLSIFSTERNERRKSVTQIGEKKVA
jgi:hypothetical protein